MKVETIEADEAEEPETHGRKAPRDVDESEGESAKPEVETAQHSPHTVGPWLELSVGGGGLTRHFDYRNEQSGALRGFYLLKAPVLGASLALFPFANADSGVSAFGLEGAFSRVLGVTSELGGNSYDTSASAYRVQLVLKFTIGEHVALRPKLGYQGRILSVAGNAVPDLHEHGPRIGFESRFRFSPFIAELEAGAQYLLSGGELTSAAWFPGATGFAADARLGAGVIVAAPFELLAQGALDYDWFVFNMRSGDPHPNGIAGGAYDIALSVSLVARLLVR